MKSISIATFRGTARARATAGVEQNKPTLTLEIIINIQKAIKLAKDLFNVLTTTTINSPNQLGELKVHVLIPFNTEWTKRAYSQSHQ